MPAKLVVVGTGIQLVRHVTLEARMHIEQAEKVLYLVADPVTATWIERLNPTAESLFSCYSEGRPRMEAYQKMVDLILESLGKGLNVCVVFYGHPGVFVFPSHEAIRQARLTGFSAVMLPGISAEDCLFADLGIDPARGGCQSYEATDFLIHKRKFDPTSSLILWQVGLIGRLEYRRSGYFDDKRGIRVLAEVLADQYGPRHETVMYEAAQYPIYDPVISRVPITDLLESKISPIATLYVPPKPTVPDDSMLAKLGILRSEIRTRASCWDERSNPQDV